MRVDAFSPPRVKRPGRILQSGSAFTVGMETEGGEKAADVPEPEAARPAMDIAGIAASSLPAARDQADQVAANHGRALLGALAGLQLACLAGAEVAARQTLANLARALPQATNPGLDSLLQAIAQRAAIELARSE